MRQKRLHWPCCENESESRERYGTEMNVNKLWHNDIMQFLTMRACKRKY